MGWCEANNAGYVLGLARNKRLQRALGKEMAAAKAAHERTGNPARLSQPALPNHSAGSFSGRG